MVKHDAKWKKEMGFCVYLRFLKIFRFSISVTYWNPCSMRVVASLMFDAVLHMYSSESSWYSVSTMCMYRSVITADLCPNVCRMMVLSLSL
jgi:hypothetical protein